MTSHRLLLLRHAKAADVAPGRGDAARPLTDSGHAQAAGVAKFLASKEFTVDHILASSAVRTRETAEDLGLDCELELLDAIYNAGSETIAEAIAEIGEEITTLLVVGHAPGIPTLAHELAGSGSEPGAVQQISTSYPTATVSSLSLDSPWAALADDRFGLGRLVEVLTTPRS